MSTNSSSTSTSTTSSSTSSNSPSHSSSSSSKSSFINDLGFSDPDNFSVDFSFVDSGINMEDNSNSLFSGSSLSILSALAILFTWFTSFPGISKQALHQLLYILHNLILPPGNLLPATYAEAYKMIQAFLVPVQEFHCCPNDCLIYRGSNENDTHCMVCGEERYLSGDIPKKRFKYLPLISRIEQYFCSANMSKLLQSHNTSLHQRTDVNDIHQTDT